MIPYIHPLDRFGRNKEYILNESRELNKDIGIDIVVLDMPLLDTAKHKDSIGTFISDLILQVLSWIAEMNGCLNVSAKELIRPLQMA